MGGLLGITASTLRVLRPARFEFLRITARILAAPGRGVGGVIFWFLVIWFWFLVSFRSAFFLQPRNNRLGFPWVIFWFLLAFFSLARTPAFPAVFSSYGRLFAVLGDHLIAMLVAPAAILFHEEFAEHSSHFSNA
ncbi:hypothetical protein BH77_18360 [Pseudomonas aeruginosa C2773C]|nr:hypothetical protein BH77_18360 [Pseudomonas aeruginosa C2773C]